MTDYCRLGLTFSFGMFCAVLLFCIYMFTKLFICDKSLDMVGLDDNYEVISYFCL